MVIPLPNHRRKGGYTAQTYNINTALRGSSTSIRRVVRQYDRRHMTAGPHISKEQHTHAKPTKNVSRRTEAACGPTGSI